MFRYAFLLVLLFNLVACGSGGDGNTSNSLQVNKAPSVNAGDDQTVVEGSEVSLEGEASDSDGSIVSYEWLQLSSDDI
ncbi:hypothetical protein H5162_12745, partial [Pseudoalteromonas sp. SR41-8]|uniref:PKD domain-containing protein n=1 Tax=Pseudoalteromonas sp. SR41-8 TaxID=2760946 RepID=UPI0018104BED|nr:hypothetical protein [Pseudoalteromonas sp. SR41-8]